MTSDQEPAAGQQSPADNHSHVTPRGIQIEADLTVGLAESTLRIHSTEGTLYVEARSFDALGELRAAAESDAVGVLRTVGLKTPFAVETPVVVRVRGVGVAQYRPAEKPGRLAGWLGLEPFDLSLPGLVRAAARRLRPPSSV